MYISLYLVASSFPSTLGCMWVYVTELQLALHMYFKCIAKQLEYCVVHGVKRVKVERV